MAYKAFLKDLEQLGVESYQGTFSSSLDMKLQGKGLIPTFLVTLSLLKGS